MSYIPNNSTPEDLGCSCFADYDCPKHLPPEPVKPSLYEAHITFKLEHREKVETCCPPGWKFSAIDGDPVLGKGVFCYLTSYDSSDSMLLSRMERVCQGFDYLGVKAVRQKIERIVYDTKTSRNEVTR